MVVFRPETGEEIYVVNRPWLHAFAACVVKRLNDLDTTRRQDVEICTRWAEEKVSRASTGTPSDERGMAGVESAHIEDSTPVNISRYPSYPSAEDIKRKQEEAMQHTNIFIPRIAYLLEAMSPDMPEKRKPCEPHCGGRWRIAKLRLHQMDGFLSVYTYGRKDVEELAQRWANNDKQPYIVVGDWGDQSLGLVKYPFEPAVADGRYYYQTDRDVRHYLSYDTAKRYRKEELRGGANRVRITRVFYPEQGS